MNTSNIIRSFGLDNNNTFNYYSGYIKFIKINNTYYDEDLNEYTEEQFNKTIKLNNHNSLENPLGIIKESSVDIKRIVYFDHGKFNYKYSNGKTINNIEYIVGNDFCFNFAVVCPKVIYQNGYHYEFNYLDLNGKLLFDENFSFAYDFSNYNCALAVDANNHFVVVTKKKLIQRYPEFQTVYPIKDLTRNNYRYLKYSYDSDKDFHDENNPMYYGLYDLKDCSLSLPPKYLDFLEYGFSYDFVFAKDLNNNLLLINKDGLSINYERFDICDFGKNQILIDKEEHTLKIYNGKIPLDLIKK